MIKGFSKLSREEKIRKLEEIYSLPPDFALRLADYRHPSKESLFDDFSENTLTNFYLPFGVAPNFLINDITYVVPMVVEESSVVAAASRSATFWAQNGAFTTTIHGTLKKGHIWFKWEGPISFLNPFPMELGEQLQEAVAPITAKMKKRGGGIFDMKIIPLDEHMDIFQLQVDFETINSSEVFLQEPNRMVRQAE